MKDFDHWNRAKKKLELSIKKYPEFVKKGEVWFAVVGVNIGSEQDGTGLHHGRPVLVIRNVNEVVSIVLPLSKKQKFNSSYYNFTDPSGQAVSIIFSHVRALSVKRFTRKMYVMPKDLFKMIVDSFRSFLFE